jgi:hypothetical protein
MIFQIRIWLPELDDRSSVSALSDHSTVESDPRATDLTEIVMAHCYGVHGGRQLAALASSFHLRLRDLARQSALAVMPGYSISYRCLQFACRTMQHLSCVKGVPPIRALAWGLLRSYGAGISHDGERVVLSNLSSLLQQYVSMWSQQRVAFAAEIESRGPARSQPIDVFICGIASTMTAFEKAGVVLIARLLHLAAAGVGGAPARPALSTAPVLLRTTVYFLERIVLPQRPASTVLASALTGLLQGSIPVGSIIRSEGFMGLIAASTPSTMLSLDAGDIQEPMDDFLRACDTLNNALVGLITNVSFVDVARCGKLLERVDLCVAPYEVVLERLGAASAPVGDRAKFYDLVRAISIARYNCTQRQLLSCWSNDSIVKQWEALNEALGTDDHRRVGWALQRELARPLTSVVRAQAVFMNLSR